MAAPQCLGELPAHCQSGSWPQQKGCPASAGPRCVPHTERHCVDSRQLQGIWRGSPSLRPARVDALSGGLLGSHPPQLQGLLGREAGQALTRQASPPQRQGSLGPSAGQARPPGEMPPVPPQRAHARHPATGIPAGQQQTTGHNMHTSSSHCRIGNRPTFLRLAARVRAPRRASHLQQQPAAKARQGGSKAEQAGARGRRGSHGLRTRQDQSKGRGGQERAAGAMHQEHSEGQQSQQGVSKSGQQTNGHRWHEERQPAGDPC